MDETEFDLRGVLGLLHRQFRLILITMVVVVALAGIATFTLTPIFTSSALVLVDPSEKNLLDPEAQINSPSADSSRIDSEVELMRSDNVLLNVIQDQNLTADEEFGVSLGTWARILGFLRLAEPQLPSGAEALNQALSQLRSAVSVQRRGLTYLISVQVRSEDPAKSADIANAVTQAYISDQLTSKINSILASRDILQARIAQARDAIVSSEGSFDSFIADNITQITQDTGRTDFVQMQRQLEQLTQARSQSAQTVQAAEQYLEEGQWTEVVASLQSSALSELERQRQEITSNLDDAAAGSPVQTNLRDELEAIEERLRQTASSEVSALRSSLQQNQTQEENLRQDMRREVLGSSLSADVLTQLYGLQQGAELARGQYQTLLSRVQDLEAQADLQLADSRIVSPALAPQFPSFPNKTLIMALAALAALGLGVGLAFLYENVIGGFTSEEQIRAVLRTPVAATIPREKAKSERETLANMMVDSPLSVFAESVRRARAAIEHTLRLNRDPAAPLLGKVIMVTSTAPNEGKSTLALSLARSYALSGQRTLLVDCDLRKPSIHRQLGIDPSHGLLEYLSAESGEAMDLSKILSKDELSKTTIIVGARRSDLPTDQLLAGASFGRLIQSGRKAFDIIILDTPPIAPVVDGLYIARFADIIMFVTRWASTSQSDAKKVVADLNAAKLDSAEIVTVLNQQDEARSSYQRKYGSYYSYST